MAQGFRLDEIQRNQGVRLDTIQQPQGIRLDSLQPPKQPGIDRVRDLANRVEGVQRPRTRFQPVEAFKAIPEVWENLKNHPMETIRGFLGGAVEGAEGAAASGSLIPGPAGAVSRAALAGMGANRAVEGFQEGDVSKIGFGALDAVPMLGSSVAKSIRAARAARNRPRLQLPAKTPSTLAAERTGIQEAADRAAGLQQPSNIDRAVKEALTELRGPGAPRLPAGINTAPTTPRVPIARPTATGAARTTPTTPQDAARAGKTVFRTKEAQKAVDNPQTFGFDDLKKLVDKSPEETTELLTRAGATPAQSQAFLREIKRLRGQSGGIKSDLAIQGGAAAIGGAAGAAQGDDLEEQVVGGLAGALLGVAGARGLQGLGRAVSGGSATRTIQSLDTANLLAGPAAIRASLGGMGGIATGIAEKVATGQPGMARRAMGYLTREAPQDYLRVLLKGKGAIEAKRFPGPTNKVLDVVLRPFKAMDTVGVKALKAAGYSHDEAVRFMLTGQATSQRGQQGVKFIQDGFFTSMLLKFPTVRTQAIERGLEFSPLGLIPRVQRGLRSAKGVEALTRGQQRFRAGAGTAGFAGGAAVGHEVDPSFGQQATLAAMAGPAALPVGLGLALGKGLRNRRGLQEVASELAFAVPSVRESDIARFFPVDPRTGQPRIPPRFLPFGLR